MPSSELKISERLLSEVWKRQMVRDGALITAAGKTVRVLYPGRQNNDSGPDFCDAIIIMGGGERIRGDVELHVRAKDWRVHGHHRDPNYNGVILHVVMWDDSTLPTVLQNGLAVPVLPLARCLDGSLEEIYRRVGVPARSFEPCQNAVEHVGAMALGQLLDYAGEERFRSKAALFGAELDSAEPGQVLYEGIMVALGYAKNKHSFRELARRLPLLLIRELVHGGDIREQRYTIQSLLLGVAGLLPSQRREISCRRDGEFGDRLEHLWGLAGISSRMSEENWRFFRVRPANFPTRRLAAASYLLTRYWRCGMLDGILRLLGGASHKAKCRNLENGFAVAADDYWAEHSDFGLGGVRSPTLVGQGRAREVVVNVVLPFFFAWADAHSQHLKKEILELYEIYPRLSQNWVTYRMSEQLAGEKASSIVNSAQRQQGLLHLYNAFCVGRKCGECPLGRAFDWRISVSAV